MSRIPLVAGNWKMNGRATTAAQLTTDIVAAVPAGVEVLLCPPLVYLDTVVAASRGSQVRLGGQNLAALTDGAVTGEVSAEMLADVGCRYVLVGHSERRTLFSEDDAVVASKFRRALAAGLQPILCVGETLAQRETEQTEQVIDAQLDAVLSDITAEQMSGVVIAYEPVWAIGTGKTASPEQAQAVHAHIRARLKACFGIAVAESLRLLYGGSVNADNAASLFVKADIDGGLIGGASLDAATFLAICQAATAK